MSHTAEIIAFPSPTGERPERRLPRQRVFYLGDHEYSLAPGACWRTEYWIKRLRKGVAWEIFATNPEDTGKQRLSMGEHSPCEMREYFESVAFYISNDEWYAMGWRDPDGANILNIDEA